MSDRKFPPSIALALLGGGALGPDKTEGGEGEDMPRAGQSKHTAEIMRLWGEGLSIGKIANMVATRNTRTIQHVLAANGISEAEIEARRIRRRRAANPAPEEPAPISWPEVAREIKCETCLHNHVCGRVKIVAERPWIACRDWERRAS